MYNVGTRGRIKQVAASKEATKCLIVQRVYPFATEFNRVIS